jgi:membrane associated rhomboid family serine protease
VTPWVQRLLIANVLVFFLQWTVPGVTEQLELVPAAMLARPWTMITYMFVHGGFGHIFWNMLALYVFGPRVEQRIGSDRFFALYMISGITGALLSFLLSPYTAVVGASGAIFGVMLAYARFWPRDRVYIYFLIPVEVRWLVIIYALISILGFGGGVAHFAHLGGFAGAMLYLLYIDRHQGAKRFRRQANAPVPAKDSLLGNWRNVDRDRVHAVNREEVDRILDKISASGLASLTPEERLFLSNFVPPDDRKPMS